ncbi:hypothetical protein OSB04_019924 [Centaurea solstitialis]|uniref:Retrovirus-related Pol polyprotein from transposon TNT 1-94 n=1 Tax=Centaurea solstitialis TaxID=347529 RepID=A0AA38T4P5_9ASTR|nr:hypothetical protein OSB04_019924 [Centaurea solstitialis]
MTTSSSMPPLITFWSRPVLSRPVLSHSVCVPNATSAIGIANNPVLHSKTKHIEVRYHFISDHVMNGDIELHFVPTEYQLADLFTKPLDVTRFNMLISELGMLNPDD